MRSDEVKRGYQRTPHRALLRATGLKDADFDKPFIGVANSFIEIIPGIFSLIKFLKLLKKKYVPMVVSHLNLIPSELMMVLPWGTMACCIRYQVVN
jgi:dihydroxyacid dehydratase/phosphogluconate dehydratase